MKKKALGKGLEAFLPDDFGILKEERYAEVDMERVMPNPHQPRMKFDESSIEELARSIRESGVLQPILVVPEGNNYKIIVGERRWRAAQKAGLQKIPVLIRTIPEEHQLEMSLIENLHREDLNPLEIALGYKKMVEELNYSQQEVADKVGKDRTSVTNTLRLLHLPQEIQDLLAEGMISMGHARALLGLEDPELQISLARQMIQDNLSVREVERLVTRLRKAPGERAPSAPDPDLHALQEELLKMLGAKVMISGNRDKGVVKIYYYSLDELNKIYDQIKGAAS